MSVTVTPSTDNRFTEEQQRAIWARDVSVALSAGAGCGKTFVLTERFLAQFDPRDSEPLSLDHLVAITFTERAAREMRDRIRQKCYERLLSAEQDQCDYWASMVRSLDAARVSTIHSFCGSLLRSHAVEAQLDPQFTILEQSQADTLLAEILDDRLRQSMSDQDECALGLIARFGLECLRHMLTRLVRHRLREQFSTWLDCGPENIVARWGEYHREFVLPVVLRGVASCGAAYTVLQVLRDIAPDNAKMRERRQLLLDLLPSLAEGQQPPAEAQRVMQRIRDAAQVQGGGRKNIWPNDEIYGTFKNAAAELRDEIDKASKYLVFDPSEALEAAAAGLQVVSLAQQVAADYQQRKNALAALDYNDLLTRAQRLLNDPAHAPLRGQLCSQIHLLLVDEFQDTDPVQVDIVSALCGDGLTSGKLFFVGDHKQSIYRFRGADPLVFRQLRQQIPEGGRLPLTLNFRSQPAILDFVNYLFAGELGSDFELLRPSHSQVTPTPVIEFLWAPADNAKELKAAQRQREADWIARRLRGLLDSEESIVWDTAAAKSGRPRPRPAGPGDIALLFRALSDVRFYEDALRQYGIDYYLVGGHAYYAQQEIFDVLNLLRSIASPVDGVSLAGALRSPFFSLDDETLFWLSQSPGGLCAGLMSELPRQLDKDQQARAAFAALTIRDLRRVKDRLGLAELIRETIARTGYDAILLGEFMGERKLANLRKLIDQARSFERSGLFGLSDFIAQLSDFVANQPDEPLAATHPEGVNVARLMTIHQSKGLEFPIVVIPDLERAARGDRAPVELSEQLGPLVRMPARHQGEKPLTGYDMHAVVSAQEEEAELLRLLYVATTRAADYLILSSGVTKLDNPAGVWMKFLGRQFDLQTGRPSMLPPSGRELPRVKVTVRRPDCARKPATQRSFNEIDKIVGQAQSRATAGEVKIPPHIGPITIDSAARRQYSFSRLTGALYDASLADLHREQQTFHDNDEVDALGLGTLVHSTLAELALSQSSDVAAAVRRQAERQLSKCQEISEATRLVEQFLSSPRAADLAQARQSHSELEFQMGWPPSASSPRVYLTGYIDRLWQDSAGEWHLIDFKTNRISPADIAKVSSRYEMQMLLYGLAVWQVFGKAPKSLILHYLRSGQEQQFAWDEQSPRRAAALINQALAAAQSIGTTQ